MNKKTDLLLARYFGGCASENDMLDLEKWLSKSEDNLTFFDQLTKLYALTGTNNGTIPKPNTQKAKEQFLHYIATHSSDTTLKEKPTISKLPQHRWLLYAASVIMILTFGISFWFYQTNKPERFTAGNVPITIILPDQTKVELSKYSELTYPADYGKNERKIKLDGEATIHVGHKGKGRLEVSASNLKIEDIGTIFTISAYPQKSNIVVLVREGIAKLYSKNSTGVTINANDTAIFDKKTESYTVLKYKPAPEPAPVQTPVIKKVSQLIFNGTPLIDVVHRLEKEFDTKIKLGTTDIGSKKLTVEFKEESFDMIMKIIAMTLDLKFENKNGIYYLLDNNE